MVRVWKGLVLACGKSLERFGEAGWRCNPGMPEAVLHGRFSEDQNADRSSAGKNPAQEISAGKNCTDQRSDS